MAAIYSNGGNRWNVLGFNFTKGDALSSIYKISMILPNISDCAVCQATTLANVEAVGRSWKDSKY
jgi:hypothetical protein